jgi:hypothetical protein
MDLCRPSTSSLWSGFATNALVHEAAHSAESKNVGFK